MYDYDSLEECRDAKDHGVDLDDDGFCNLCGEMDYDDEDWDEEDD